MPDRFHQLILFNDSNFQKEHKHVFRSTNLGNNLGWGVSSFAVTGGVWQLHKDQDFQVAYGSLFAPRIGGYSWVKDYNIANDSISSAKLLEDDERIVPHAILFKKPNFVGDHRHIVANTTDLGSWSEIGSLVIFYGIWQFEFTYSPFVSAVTVNLGPGTYPTVPMPPSSQPLAQPPQRPQLSSITLKSVGRHLTNINHLIVFEDRDFGGDHRHIFDSVSHLNDGWDNKISAIAVEFGAWSMCNQANFRESQGVILTRGIYPFVEDIEITDNQITSIQLVSLPSSDLPLITPTKINNGQQALTAHGGNYRLGWNPNEVELTPENVRLPYFGKVWARNDLDGARVYAEPLYVSADPISEKPDMVVVATAANNVFALDAMTGFTIWQTPQPLGEPLKQDEFDAGLFGFDLIYNLHATKLPCDNTTPLHGINSTPVIHPTGQIIYICYLAKKRGNQEPDPENDYNQAYYLQALYVATGQPVWAHPVELKGTFQRQDGSHLPFLPYIHTQRGALTYAELGERHNMVLVPFSSRCDLLSKEGNKDWQGWIFAVNVAPNPPILAATFASSVVDTDREGCGGIWSEAGLSVDDQKRIYVVTGNGKWNGVENFADSILCLELQHNRIAIDRYYTPRNWDFLGGKDWKGDERDLDLGGSSALLLPPQPRGYYIAGAPVTMSIIMTAGKDGRVYLVPGNLPGSVPGQNFTKHQLEAMLGHAIWRPQVFNSASTPVEGGIGVTAAYFDAGPDGRFLYVASAADGEHHGLVAIKFDDLNGETMLGARIIQFEGEKFSGAPGTPFVSSNGPNNGIVWIVDSFRDSSDDGPDSVLRAWDALTGRLLYSSPQTDHQKLGNGRKFVGLTVIKGKVFVPAQGVACYGLAIVEP